MSSGRHSSSPKLISLPSGHPHFAILPPVSPSQSHHRVASVQVLPRFFGATITSSISIVRLMMDIPPYRSALTIVYFNSSLTPAGPGDWLGGLNIDDFAGKTIAERVVRAAHSIGADYISPTMTSGETPVEIVDPSQEGWIGFVNQTMVDVAHELGMGVKPWTAK
jgi:hypothetical protein